MCVCVCVCEGALAIGLFRGFMHVFVWGMQTESKREAAAEAAESLAKILAKLW